MSLNKEDLSALKTQVDQWDVPLGNGGPLTYEINADGVVEFRDSDNKLVMFMAKDAFEQLRKQNSDKPLCLVVGDDDWCPTEDDLAEIQKRFAEDVHPRDIIVISDCEIQRLSHREVVALMARKK